MCFLAESVLFFEFWESDKKATSAILLYLVRHGRESNAQPPTIDTDVLQLSHMYRISTLTYN